MAGDPTGSQPTAASLTVITEAGAAAQTPFPYSILGSEIRLQNQFYPLFGVRCKVLGVTGWGHGLTGVQNASWDDCAVTGPSKYNHYFQNGLDDTFFPLSRTVFPPLSEISKINFKFFNFLLIFSGVFWGRPDLKKLLLYIKKLGAIGETG